MEHNIENVKKEGKVTYGAKKIIKIDLAGNKQTVQLQDGSVVERSIYPSKEVVKVEEPVVVEVVEEVVIEPELPVVEVVEEVESFSETEDEF